MTIVEWVVVGLIVGFLASRIVNRRGEGILLDLALGIGGALLGGYMCTSARSTPVSGFDTYSALAATAGAILIVFINCGIRWALGDKLT